MKRDVFFQMANVVRDDLKACRDHKHNTHGAFYTMLSSMKTGLFIPTVFNVSEETVFHTQCSRYRITDEDVCTIVREMSLSLKDDTWEHTHTFEVKNSFILEHLPEIVDMCMDFLDEDDLEEALKQVTIRLVKTMLASVDDWHKPTTTKTLHRAFPVLIAPVIHIALSEDDITLLMTTLDKVHECGCKEAHFPMTVDEMHDAVTGNVDADVTKILKDVLVTLGMLGYDEGVVMFVHYSDTEEDDEHDDAEAAE